MTDDGLTLRRVSVADRPEILRLLAASLGRDQDPRFEALFAWKHLENAFGESPAWVACDGDRIAGFRTLMRWEFTAGDRILHAVRAVDTATHPDYQGRGIFTRLTLHALDELTAAGTDFVFNTPNEQSRPGYLKMGWHVVGQLSTVVRPTRLSRIARIAKARVPAERWSIPSRAGEDAAEVVADASGLATLIAERGPSTAGIETRLSPEFLAWRFGTPLLGYRAIVADAGLDHGVAVFRIRARGSAREAALVSLLTRGGDHRTAARLVGSVRRAADADYVLGLGGPRRWPGGLVRVPKVGPLLTHRPLADPAAPSAWNLTLGDIELF